MENSKQFFVSCALIFNEQNKVLLTKRYHPGNSEVHNKWQLPGGSVDPGEHPEQAAVREVFEETGLTIEILSPRPYVFSHTFSDGAHIILIVYRAVYVAGNLDISGDEDETSDARWFEIGTIKDLDTLPETNEIIAAILKE